mgnify:CR=1 FL=1
MMKRKLIMQMRNEWRSNVWMMVEILVVGLVLWVSFAILCGLYVSYHKPVGADYADIYVGSIGKIEEGRDSYAAYDDNHSYKTDIRMLLANLANNPNVEIAGLGSNALPYSYNFHGSRLKTEINGKTELYNCNVRVMSPEVIKAIRLRGINGETPEQLAGIVAGGGYIISVADYAGEDSNPLSWRGKEASSWRDSTDVHTVGAIVNPIRRTDYEPAFGNLIRYDENDNMSEVIVRVKEGRGDEFIASLSGSNLEFGNVYVSNMMSLDDIREECHRNISTQIRNVATCVVFVLVSVFLGFLGTFRYRTQQRVPEQALRKVCGATNADLFRRLIGEGLLLLVIPAILMVPAGLAASDIVNQSGSQDEIIIGGVYVTTAALWCAFAMSVAALALIIIAGIWMPARKSMRVEPSVALNDQ